MTGEKLVLQKKTATLAPDLLHNFADIKRIEAEGRCLISVALSLVLALRIL